VKEIQSDIGCFALVIDCQPTVGRHVFMYVYMCVHFLYIYSVSFCPFNADSWLKFTRLKHWIFMK